MGVESIILCIDNSEWMRNGDFIPTRLHAQQDAVNMVARFKTKENVETSIGLLTLSDTQVRVPLTTDYNKIAKNLQLVEPKDGVKFITGIRIAQLVLKHRLNRNHKTRIIVFVASPIIDDHKEMERLAKRLKKEKIHVDIVSFGEEEQNIDKLSHFIETLNGTEQKDTSNKCHLVQARPGPMLSDVLMNSPIMAGEDGVPIGMGGTSSYDFDPMTVDDPELAMALRVSLEEQRQRQDDEARRVQQESLEQMQTDDVDMMNQVPGGGILEQASQIPYTEVASSDVGGVSDVSALTEEQQLALALQMSMSGMLPEERMELEQEDSTVPSTSGGAQGGVVGGGGDDAEMQELIKNKEFLESVLSSLPGVNAEEAMQNYQEITKSNDEDKQQKNDKKDDEQSQ